MPDEELTELLHTVLVNRFVLTELQQLVRFKLGIQVFQNVASLNDSFQDVAFKLIEFVERRGNIGELIRAVYDARKADDTKRLFESYFSEDDRDEKPFEDVVSSATLGLETIGQHFRTNEAVKEIMGSFRDGAVVIRDRIQTLGKYKGLHDCLHQLQFKLFRNLDRAVNDFVAEPATGIELQFYIADLNSLVQEIEETIEGLPSLAVEQSLVDSLKRAVLELQVAVTESKPDSAKLSIQAISAVLDVQPARINGHLTATAEEMPIRGLVETLERVKDKTEDIADSVASQFDNGLGSLRRIEPTLGGIVAQHVHWQKLDLLLRMTDRMLANGPGGIRINWPNIHKATNELVSYSMEQPWAVSLKRSNDKINQAVEQSAYDNIVRDFDLMKHLSGNQFYLVDKDLRDKCGKLNTIGIKLETIYGVLFG